MGSPIPDPGSRIGIKRITSVWWELQSAWLSLCCHLLPRDFRRLILNEHTVLHRFKKEDVKKEMKWRCSSITSTILLFLFCYFCLTHTHLIHFPLLWWTLYCQCWAPTTRIALSVRWWRFYLIYLTRTYISSHALACQRHKGQSQEVSSHDLKNE